MASFALTETLVMSSLWPVSGVCLPPASIIEGRGPAGEEGPQVASFYANTCRITGIMVGQEKGSCNKHNAWYQSGPVLTVQFSSVQLLSHVQLFVTPWTAACQASLSITNSQSLLKLMSMESVMPSNHLILCRPLLFLPSFNLFQHQGLFQ